MHLSVIAKILGLLLMLFSATMLPPVLVAWIYQDGGQVPFLTSFVTIFVTGLLVWLPFMRANAELQTRDGFLVVTLFWTVLGAMGSIPLILVLDMSITDAVFESISGLTTTGATVTPQVLRYSSSSSPLPKTNALSTPRGKTPSNKLGASGSPSARSADHTRSPEVNLDNRPGRGATDGPRLLGAR